MLGWYGRELLETRPYSETHGHSTDGDVCWKCHGSTVAPQKHREKKAGAPPRPCGVCSGTGVTYSRMPGYNVHIPRQLLRAQIVRKVPPGVIRWGYEFESYAEDPGAGVVTVRFRGVPDPLRARVLVGADGIYSRVRVQRVSTPLGAGQAPAKGASGGGARGREADLNPLGVVVRLLPKRPFVPAGLWGKGRGGRCGGAWFEVARLSRWSLGSLRFHIPSWTHGYSRRSTAAHGCTRCPSRPRRNPGPPPHPCGSSRSRGSRARRMRRAYWRLRRRSRPRRSRLRL
jgi:hypothetical protein